jgi:hypothetical protein
MSDAVDDAKADIDRTREQLAGTTAALAAKADVKGRATVAAKEHQQQLTLAAGVTALLVVLLAWNKRRHQPKTKKRR